jgi:hypothetical protein
VPGAVGSRAPVQAVEAARVSSRPAQARDSVVHADEESTKTTSQTLFSMVLQPEDSVKRRRSARGRVEGVFAWCQACPAPSFPSFVADCSPEPIPDRGAELNLFIACIPSRAWRTAAEHKGTLRDPQRPAPPQLSPCSSSLFIRRCKHVALLQSSAACVEHRRAPCVARPVSLEDGRLIGRPHTTTASCSLANISSSLCYSPRAASRSVLQHAPAFQVLCLMQLGH